MAFDDAYAILNVYPDCTLQEARDAYKAAVSALMFALVSRGTVATGVRFSSGERPADPTTQKRSSRVSEDLPLQKRR